MINIALFGWPLVTVLAALRTHWPVAVIIGIFGGYLLLPERHGINLPLLPTFNKDTIPSLTLIILALLLRPGQWQAGMPQGTPAEIPRPGWLPTTMLGKLLLFLFLFGAIMTALTNGDQLVFGPRVTPGLSLYDGFASIVASTALLVPLILGRKYFASPEAHRLLLAGLVIAAFLYSFLALYEVRMSPRLNSMVYGFFPHDWRQHIRGDGFRPIVFLLHGLQLSLFLGMGTLAAIGLYRVSTGTKRTLALTAALWLFMALVLSKSLGALIVVIVLAPIVLFLSVRLQLPASMMVAVIVLTYPMLRSADVIPTDRLIAIAEDIDPGRAASLAFRIRHEDALLERAAERPLFGWGGRGRNRIYNEETGASQSVTDGSWVITIGSGGWAEYLSRFGLLTLPIILLALRSRRMEIDPATAGLSLVLMANAIDLIPNSGQTPITWLIAGALLGRLEFERAAQNKAVAPEGTAMDRGPAVRQTPGTVYTRQTLLHERQTGKQT